MCLGSAACVEIVSFHSHTALRVKRFVNSFRIFYILECDSFCRQHSCIEFQRFDSFGSKTSRLQSRSIRSYPCASDHDGPSTGSCTSCFASSPEQIQLSLVETKPKNFGKIGSKRKVGRFVACKNDLLRPFPLSCFSRIEHPRSRPQHARQRWREFGVLHELRRASQWGEILR